MKVRLLFLLFVTVGVFSCLDKDEQTDPLFILELVVLHEEGNERSLFNADTDITLALKIINRSENPIPWNYIYTCQIIAREGVFDIFKFTKGFGGPYFFVGTPFPTDRACLTINYPDYDLPPGETILCKVPWSNNPENEPLTPGKYFTTINSSVSIGDRVIDVNLFEEFEIK